ncbi:hypothetical protein J0667_13895 [Methylomonas sp. WH-1]|uniref:hypothetical protein n=1 Tax=unclassified Methylomonas TaxID=2608980 RepID=UPI00101EA9F2|nr:hypothetical protein [Methylomonas sp. LW13]
MSFHSKATQLVTKLIRFTNENKIQWNIKDPPSSITRGTDDIVPIYFEAKYKDKYVAIYQQRYQSFYPENESFYWSERIVFAVLDAQDRVLWECADHSPALIDLMNTVREKSAGIDNLLDDLLDDEI